MSVDDFSIDDYPAATATGAEDVFGSQSGPAVAATPGGPLDLGVAAPAPIEAGLGVAAPVEEFQPVPVQEEKSKLL